MLELSTNVEEVPKIGEKYAKKLKKLGIKTVQDLLFYFPARYDDFSDIIPINQIKVGQIACVQGRIISIDQTLRHGSGQAHTFRKWDITEVVIEDETGQITALWFNQPYLTQSLKEDQYICLAGKVSLGRARNASRSDAGGQNGIYLNNPAHERIYEDSQNDNLTHTGRIIPVYSETKGVTSRWLRYIIKPLLIQFHTLIPEILPQEIVEKQKFLPVSEAIWQAHFPESFECADAAKARFAFEDLLLLQLSVLKEKAKLQQNVAVACPMNAALMKEFTKSLPFQLTDSQRQCSFQILKDLEKQAPMSRLLQGDVGSGKTVVATMAALSVVKNGHQVAFMAPTAILATQHYGSISKMLKHFGVSIELLTGKTTGKKQLLKELAGGEIDILIGTQALISKGVKFKNLALIVLDEQHRFGVNQRAELTHSTSSGQARKMMPHLLSMTATPIPRTLALTVYGDLDLSLIKEMPKDRKKIITTVVAREGRQKAYEFIKNEVAKGRGVFVICPKIEAKEAELEGLTLQGSLGGSDPPRFTPQNYNFRFAGSVKEEIKSVKKEYEKLSKEIFPDLRITMLYGKMKAEEKERIMQDFKKGEVDILLSTSVVEVGVDVPRATIMMIEGAERFGLSQLHQFRGRVGRSDMQSYCFLFTTEENQQNRKRLKAMEKSSNGFELAEEDLKIRGPGQLYGTQQWGLPDAAMQNLSNIFLIEKTRSDAKELLEKDPELKNYPLLKERLQHFEQKIHFE